MSDKEENKFYDTSGEDIDEEMTDYDSCFFCPMMRYCPVMNQFDEEDIEDFSSRRPKMKKGNYPHYPKKYYHYNKKYTSPFMYPYMFPFFNEDWEDGWDEDSDWD